MGLRSVLKIFLTIVLCVISTHLLYARQGGFEQFHPLAEKLSVPPHDFPEGSNTDFSGAPHDVVSCNDPENIIDEFHFLLYLAFAPEQIDDGLAPEEPSEIYSTPRTAGFNGEVPSETTPEFAGSKRIFSAGDLNGDGCDELLTFLEDLPQDELRDLALVFSFGTITEEDADAWIEHLLNEEIEQSEATELAPETGYQFDSFITDHDYDGDGYDDLLLASESEASDLFHTAFGNMMLDNLDFASFSMSSLEKAVANTDDFFRFNAADIDGDGDSEVIVLSSVQNPDFSSTGRIRVFDIDENRESTLIQEIALPAEFSSSAIILNFYALDIDGADEANPVELLIVPPRFTDQNVPGPESFVIDTDPETGEFMPELMPFSDLFISSVGDLNNDGRHDFLLGNEEGKPFIAFGPSDISSGLSLDVALSAGDDPDFTFSHPPYIRSGRYGDLNNDGIDDTIIGHTENTNIKIGRRFVFGSADGNLTSEFGLYDRNVFFNTFASSANVGDVNGDDFDDFAIVRDDEYQVDIFFGREVLNLTPDVVLQADRTREKPVVVTSGDFNGDGFSDVTLSTLRNIAVDIYFGGSNMDGEVNHRFDPALSEDIANANDTQVRPDNIGDINNDGIDDFLIPSGFAQDSESNFLNQAWIFYGGNTLSSTPDITIDYNDDENLSGNFRNIGGSAAGGDFNGDGVADLAIQIGTIVTDGFVAGGAYIYFGTDESAKQKNVAAPDFSAPGLILRPMFEDVTNKRGGQIAAGDFDGDGVADIALGITSGSGDGTETPVIQIFKGGVAMDDSADVSLTAPADAFGGEEGVFFNSTLGRFDFLPDDDGDGIQDLLMATSGGFGGGTNAAIYKGGTEPASLPSQILVAPNPSIGLGGARSVAAGDFNNDGNNDILLVQTLDRRDSFDSSRSYFYSPGAESFPVPIEGEIEVPEKFILSQNFPNPFNPSTVIRYQVPVHSVVKLDVFDMLGRKVVTLVDGESQPAGEYSKPFDASSLASGMYIYRLAAGEFVQTRKMLLVK